MSDLLKFKPTPETAEAFRWYVQLLEDTGILIPIGRPGQSSWQAQDEAFKAVIDDLKKRADAAEQGVELNAHGHPMSQEAVDHKNSYYDELNEQE